MIRVFVTLILVSFMLPAAHAASNKQERNYITEGNALYRQQRYAEAETMYKKALTASPNSEVAKFNLASALIRLSGTADPNKGNTPLDDAIRLLNDLAQNAEAASIAEKASYDLGNIAYNKQDYKGAVENYKNALRKNPDNDKARQNLRLAQKKLQEQQQNQDKNKDQEQKQNQDQQKQQQDQKQDQQKPDQPKDNNQDKDKQQPQPQQPKGGISDENAQKILKAMENEEAATRQKIEARKQKAQNARRRQVTKPW